MQEFGTELFRPREQKQEELHEEQEQEKVEFYLEKEEVEGKMMDILVVRKIVERTKEPEQGNRGPSGGQTARLRVGVQLSVLQQANILRCTALLHSRHHQFHIRNHDNIFLYMYIM